MSETKPLLIYCDVDGVCAALMPAWIGLYNEDYGDTLNPENVLGWDIHDHVKPECGQSIYEYLHLSDLYHSVEPVAGALEGVTALRKAGHRVVFATSTNIHQAGKKLNWLARHGFIELERGTRSPDYVEVQDKSLLRGDILIDDGFHNVSGFTERVGQGAYGSGKAILFDAPWNRHEQWNMRALDWAEVVRLVLEEAQR